MKKTSPKKDKKRTTDINQIAHALVQQSTHGTSEPDDAEVSRVMASLGRKGGKVGGKKRAESLTPERRRDIALKAARKRWDKALKHGAS
jgi:hypothetical protein